MIIAGVIVVIFTVLQLFINALFIFIPTDLIVSSNIDISSISILIRNAFVFVPVEMIALLLSSIVFWYGARLALAIVEWLYKKIPGVN